MLAFQLARRCDSSTLESHCHFHGHQFFHNVPRANISRVTLLLSAINTESIFTLFADGKDAKAVEIERPNQTRRRDAHFREKAIFAARFK